MIEITVNGENRAFDASISVAELLTHLSIDTQKVALERNREIVSKSLYDTTHITQGDVIEIIAFVGGG